MSGESRPLVVRFGALGDLIVTTPLLRALAARHRAPCDVLARSSWARDVLRELPFVANVQTVERKNQPYWLAGDQRAAVNWLRSRATGPVYVLETDAKSRRLLSRANIEPNVCCAWDRQREGEHIIDYHARICGFSAPYNRSPELRVNSGERQDCDRWLSNLGIADHPLIVVQIVNRKTSERLSKDIKSWGAQNWIEVIHAVLNEMSDARVLLNGLPSEMKAIADVVRRTRDSRVLVSPPANLRQLFALLARAHSMISVDTGPAHAAAAIGCPLAVLFGQTDPRDIGPVGASSPVQIVTGSSHSMESISPLSVIRAWLEIARKSMPESAMVNS